ncbi:hypothetical protein K474DRAFT_1125905 [Panus rudis PR-1116 ss-1]|nr:hypothetical protein K474DRAFT_1125905 [Panus rudis PR-1116 ss-1]
MSIRQHSLTCLACRRLKTWLKESGRFQNGDFPDMRSFGLFGELQNYTNRPRWYRAAQHSLGITHQYEYYDWLLQESTRFRDTDLLSMDSSVILEKPTKKWTHWYRAVQQNHELTRQEFARLRGSVEYELLTLKDKPRRARLYDWFTSYYYQFVSGSHRYDCSPSVTTWWLPAEGVLTIVPQIYHIINRSTENTLTEELREKCMQRIYVESDGYKKLFIQQLMHDLNAIEGLYDHKLSPQDPQDVEFAFGAASMCTNSNYVHVTDQPSTRYVSLQSVMTTHRHIRRIMKPLPTDRQLFEIAPEATKVAAAVLDRCNIPRQTSALSVSSSRFNCRCGKPPRIPGDDPSLSFVELVRWSRLLCVSFYA